MTSSKHFLLSLTTLSLCFSISLAFFPGSNTHFMGPGFPNGAHPLTGLCPEYYRFTCPQADEIVISVLKEAIAKNPRIAASLLRLHFHDCFVQVNC
jgi:peroxidase